MKNGRPEGEDAESMPVHSDLRPKHRTGDTGGRPSWRSSFQALLAQSLLGGWLKKTAVAGAVGKVKIPMLYRDFQVTWESPAFGLFQVTAFSTGRWIHRFCFRAVKTPKEKTMTKNYPKPMPVLAVPKLSEGQLEPLFRRLNLV